MKVLIILLAIAARITASPTPYSKITDMVQTSLLDKRTINVLVSFEGTSQVLESLREKTTRMKHGERATAVYNVLNTHAKNSQSSVLRMLNSVAYSSLEFKSFWITNQIYIGSADAELIQALAAFEEVKMIHEENIGTLDAPISSPSPHAPHVQWGIKKIKAREAWSIAGNGTGAVVGIIDTGVRFTHVAIKDSYRAGSHSWFDPYKISPNPRDGNGHGTHVTGTIVGKNGIGVAPGSKWIACKAFTDSGRGLEKAFLACGEFMLCPHEYNLQNPNCYLAPHLVSNSWGTEGSNSFYDGVISAWHAANIIPVFAAGNSGPQCSTLGSPAESLAGVIAVAASDSNDAIAAFSSRGPSAHPHPQAFKPDITAPGVDILSAGIVSDDAYVFQSGTSMACPHVAGVVALLKANNPDATYEDIASHLITTADQNLTFGSSNCGGISEDQFPNYSFGHGRINALAAVEAFSKAI